MNRKKLIRILAIVLAALLVGGVVFSALVSALAEEQTVVGNVERNRHEITLEYLEDEQALHITQRLIYINETGIELRSVVFYAAGNMFRRESALMYGPDALEQVFFDGYAPAGIDLRTATCDGKPTDFGFQGEDELYMRVDCDVAPGESCAFEFDYYLLLMRCGAFQGVGDTDVRLSAFYFAPVPYDEALGEFAIKKPLAFTRWLHSAAADFAVRLTLPEGWEVASTGEGAAEDDGSDGVAWRITAENVREFALSFGKRYRVAERMTDSGVRVRALTNVRGGAKRALDAAMEAVEQCEAWFGPFPASELDLAQSDYPVGALNFPGAVWVPEALLAPSREEDLKDAIRFCVAQQYFGLSAYVEPVADAWLSDSVSAYVAMLLREAAEGHDSFLAAVNREWVSALQQTVPGGLTVTSDAALFDEKTYDIVVRRRGAVVLHELREAMGLEALLAGLSNFYRMGGEKDVLTEMDFVAAMDAADGGSWEDFLTDWVFNVGDYVNQTIDWFE